MTNLVFDGATVEILPPVPPTIPFVVIPGPAGPRGAAGGFQVFTFASPTTTWTMAHNLGHHPAAVTAYDLVGVAEVAYEDDGTTTTIEWNLPTAGQAVIA